MQPYFAVELKRKPCCLGACTTTTTTTVTTTSTVLHLLFRYIDFSFSSSLLLWPVIGQAMVSPCALRSSSTRCTNFLIESRRQERAPSTEFSKQTATYCELSRHKSKHKGVCTQHCQHRLTATRRTLLAIH